MGRELGAPLGEQLPATHISRVSAGTSFSLSLTPVWYQPWPCSQVSGEFSLGPRYKLSIKVLCPEAVWSCQTRWAWQVLAAPTHYQPVNGRLDSLAVAQEVAKGGNPIHVVVGEFISSDSTRWNQKL